ncbi:MAG TPA: glycosyltransferase family 4 protein [Gemmatimonadaceae bacterium]|nr:glycosyltransferase family 4 protein [Gemmatimonadaceae bacterium]
MMKAGSRRDSRLARFAPGPEPARAERRPRVLIAVNSDWFFLSHRLPIARAARDAGADVVVLADDTGRGADIEREGFTFIPLSLSRHGVNPLRELTTMLAWLRMYRQLRPDLVHHVTIKPVLYGSLAARAVPGVAVVNAVTGLGYVFSGYPLSRLLRPIVTALYRLATRGPGRRTVFQNSDDRARFLAEGLAQEAHTVLIRGSGVDCSRFAPAPEPEGTPVVMLASRLLWDKGVGEFVEAARLLRDSPPRARFVIVGRPDDGNRTAVPVAQLEAWVREGVVEWWGYRDDMPATLRSATIFALPSSYPEGVPKVLIEAAASARPIVTTDVPGCREVVRTGVNGILVPPRDGAAVARATRTLLESPELRRRYGEAGRAIALAEFTVESVVERTLEVYRALLGARWTYMHGNGGSARAYAH